MLKLADVQVEIFYKFKLEVHKYWWFDSIKSFFVQHRYIHMYVSMYMANLVWEHHEFY